MAPTDPMHGLTTAIGERIEHAIFRSESAQLNRRGWGRFSCQQSKQGRLWSSPSIKPRCPDVGRVVSVLLPFLRPPANELTFCDHEIQHESHCSLF